LSLLILCSLQELKDEVDSPSGDIHGNEDYSSSGSGSEHSCPQEPADTHTDVSHSESKSFVQSFEKPLLVCLFVCRVRLSAANGSRNN
jgi:hypothetical protein